jgi:K+-transporting ATPase ATPase A chain
MDTSGWLQLLLLIAAILVISPPMGAYLARIYGDGPAPGDRFFLPIENRIYRMSGIDPKREQRWTAYAVSLLAFSLVGVLLLYAIQRLQAVLPLNPTGMPAVPPGLAFSTAVSFVTNTNWQSYGGETTLSHLSQMAGLATQNFVSAAAGMAVMAALLRGLARRRATTVGNFWVDLVRTTLRFLVPLSLVLAVVFVSQGMIQNYDGFQEVTTLEGATQAIPGGPVASQLAIKQLGTNGGGFFNTNSSHPFENPNGITNFLSTLSLSVVSFATALAYGRMVGSRRQGWAVFAAMFVLWLVAVGVTIGAETAGNPRLTELGADQTITVEQPGGNMEGKEVRFGPAASAIWASSTTSTSNGSVNSMHDSYTPIGGLVTLGNMLLGEVSPGGVGVGLNGMLVMVILTVFIAGLMVGRTPEYLGKKIQAAEVKLVVLYLLAMPLMVLGFTAASVLLPDALASRANQGPHGLSEILYAFTSNANNNGSAFAGLTTNTNWFNPTQSLAMLIGRFFLIIPTLGIAGAMVRKQAAPPSVATFATDKPLFLALLIGVIIIVAGLTFFPVLALGPIVEHLSL